MDKKVLSIYKVPLLAALVLAITIIGINVVRDWFPITMIIVGCFAGIIFVDMEYIIYAYFMEPAKDFSRTVKGFIKDRDFKNLIKFIDYHKNDIPDKSINSALFQGVFALFSIFAIVNTNSYFLKALILSIYVNLFYKLMDAYLNRKSDTWFWILKNKPDNTKVILYMIGLCAIFVYCLRIF